MAEKSEDFCAIPLGPKTLVCAASTMVKAPATLEQTTHPSVRIQARYSGLLSGPRRGRDRVWRTGTCRFGGTPGSKGTFLRKGTRLVSTNHLDRFVLKDGRPAQDARMASRAGCSVLRRAQAGRTRPPNSSSHCLEKLQCLWLHSMDCRFGQYIPDPMAFCAIGYRTWVARMSGSPTV